VTTPLESLRSEALALCVEIARLQTFEHDLNDARMEMEEQARRFSGGAIPGAGGAIPEMDALGGAIRHNAADLEKTRGEIKDLRRKLDTITAQIEVLERRRGPEANIAEEDDDEDEDAGDDDDDDEGPPKGSGLN